MDFCCSKSVAGLALLIGGGGCAFLTPVACAGDRIEFSAPAIPLSVPQPEVEIKEPNKMIGAADDAVGIPDGAAMQTSTEIVITHSKNRDPWDANPLPGDNPDQINGDDWMTSPPEPVRLTNDSSLNMQHGWEASDSDSLLRRRDDSMLGAGQQGLRFGAQNEPDNNYGRDANQFGRSLSDEKEDPFWSKIFSRDPTATDRFGGGGPSSLTSSSRSMTGGAAMDQINPMEAASAQTQVLPDGYGSYAPSVNSQGRQTDQQTWATQGYPQLRDPSSTRRATSSSISKTGENTTSRFAAPNRPANLQMPKHPGDPF